jgi:D-alanyl-D-alanine carboxypeptidase
MAIAVATTMGTKAHAQQVPSAVQARLQFVLDSMVSSSTNPTYIAGMSAAIRIRNGATWKGVTGFAGAVGTGVTTAIPWQDTMRSRVYSVTKSFTASIILSLMAEGRLSLDDSIGKWIDTLVSNPLPNIRNNATIRQCLTHATGHADYVTNIQFLLDVLGNQGLKVYTPRESIAFAGAPLFPLGTSRSYSSTNYILLGMVAESVTDSTMAQLYRHRIFNPLGLSNTYFGQFEPSTGFLAHPHDNLAAFGLTPNQTVNIQNVFPFTSIVSAAWATGGIVSTAEDIAKYAMHLYGGTAIPPRALDSMLRSIDTLLNTIPTNLVDDFPGYGVFNNTSVAPGFVGHGGSATGYRAFMYGNPQNGVNIAILCNQQPASLDRIAKALYEELPASLLSGAPQEAPVPSVGFVETYPNPTSTWLNVGMYLSKPSRLNIVLYGIDGKEVQKLMQQNEVGEGYQLFTFATQELPSGMYYCHIVAGDQVLVRKIVVD